MPAETPQQRREQIQSHLGYPLSYGVGIEAVDDDELPTKGYVDAHTTGVTSAFFRPLACSDVDDVVSALLGITPATIEISEEARAMYLGVAPVAFTTAKVGVDLFTPAAGTDWCEVAILKGTPVLFDGPSSLTLVGFADASVDWSVPGPVATTIGGISVASGDHLWLAWSIKQGGGTLPAFRATLPDAILTGFFVFASGVRLSTMGAGTNFNRVGSAERGARAGVGCS